MSDIPSVSTHLRSELDDGLLQIVLARPDKLNALLGETLDGIATLVRWAAVQPSVRCVLLWAEGKVFSVGDDLRGMGPRMGVESDEAECIDSYPHVVAEIVRLRKPVVVALHGAVYGAAMEIALACDLRVGDRTVVYGPVYAEHAFASGTSLLPLFVGVPAARRLLLLADPVEADKAHQLGLLDELTEPGEALALATELAHRLAHGPTRAYGLIKSALLEGVGRGLLENLHTEENISYVSLTAGDAHEGKRAFAEKRAPIYRGT
jgi:2-(1,2-epoxy-1,2-dihydrophenyl)acetyl-CoA isomerase